MLLYVSGSELDPGQASIGMIAASGEYGKRCVLVYIAHLTKLKGSIRNIILDNAYCMDITSEADKSHPRQILGPAKTHSRRVMNTN